MDIIRQKKHFLFPTHPLKFQNKSHQFHCIKDHCEMDQHLSSSTFTFIELSVSYKTTMSAKNSFNNHTII